MGGCQTKHCSCCFCPSSYYGSCRPCYCNWAYDETGCVCCPRKGPRVHMPNDDPDSSGREKLIDAAREEYQWENDGKIPPHIKDMPIEEQFTAERYTDFAASGIEGAANLLKVKKDSLVCEPLKSVADFKKFYKVFPQSKVVNRWMRDDCFADQRLNACLPMLLERCDRIPPGFNVTDKDVKKILKSGETLAKLIKAKRLFIVDYHMMQDLPIRDGFKQGCPYVLFYVVDGKLMPLAIQLERAGKFTDPAAGSEAADVRSFSGTGSASEEQESIEDDEVEGGGAGAPFEEAEEAEEEPLDELEEQQSSASGSASGSGSGKSKSKSAASGSGSGSGSGGDKKYTVFVPPSRDITEDNYMEDARHMTWTYVKMCVQNADSLTHQFMYHLTNTHLVGEACWIAIRRTMSERHPLSEMVRPFFRYTIAINVGARGGTNGDGLLAPGGAIDQTFAIGRTGALEMVRRAWNVYNFQERNLLKDFKSRNVDSVDNFYFRDDGKLIYKAIENFVTAIINVYYEEDENVKDDPELQAMFKEMKSKKGGAIKGLPAKLDNKKYLIELFTQMMWTASGGHAGINFTQWEYMSFVPNYPLALRRVPKKVDEIKSEEVLLKAMPYMNEVSLQILYARVLTTPPPTFLGDFEAENFYVLPNKTFKDATAAFKAELADIKQQINKANQDREFPYEYLQPRKVPNSVAI